MATYIEDIVNREKVNEEILSHINIERELINTIKTLNMRRELLGKYWQDQM